MTSIFIDDKITDIFDMYDNYNIVFLMNKLQIPLMVKLNSFIGAEKLMIVCLYMIS